MTVLIELPGILASTAGLEKVVTTLQGFPDVGLDDLFLFEDVSGPAVANAVQGRGAGLIEKINNGDYGGSYSWLGATGGLELQGSQIVSMPAFDAAAPWSLVYMGAITGHISGATEAITDLIAFRDRSNSDIRGPALLCRSFQAGGVSGYYQHRAWQGATDGAAQSLSPATSLSVVGRHCVAVMSYNGTDTVTSAIYDKTGSLVASGSVSAVDPGMTTSGGVIKAEIQPTIGTSNSIYDGGIQQVEAFARYSRLLSQDDIARLCARAAALGESRGRPW